MTNFERIKAMNIDELAKGFGVYSLPIRVVRYTHRDGKTILALYMGEKINNYLLSTNRSHVFPVLEFMAKSANLMPEAVEVLDKCTSELLKRCDCCAGKAGRACIGCSNSETRAEILALLAKLEGGADNATNP